MLTKRRSSPSVRYTLLGAACLTVVALGSFGCANYRWGQQTLYRPDIQTVHVPIFESESFRRELGERLTEAVAKEINLRTPYRVVGRQEADSVLSGRIISFKKNVIAEDEYDVPRVLDTAFVVDVKWVGAQGDLLANNITIPLDDYFVRTATAAVLIPEAGQSVVTSQQKAIDQLAQQIVSQMEMPPW
jgi:hypothetical protein